MKFTLQSGYIQCFLTFKKYEHILSKQYVLVLHTLCIFIPVLTSYPSPFLIHTPLTLVCFFNLLSLFLCKPLGTLYWHQEREREGSRSHQAVAQRAITAGCWEKTMRDVIYIWQQLQWLKDREREDGEEGWAASGGIIHSKYFVFLSNDCVDSLCKGSGEGSLRRQKQEEIKQVISMEGGNQLHCVIRLKPTPVWPITIYPCVVSDNRCHL